MNFEDLLSKLNEIADKMEDKNTSIEESFHLFEQGLKLSEEGTKVLADYARRFDKLKQKWEEIDSGLSDDD